MNAHTQTYRGPNGWTLVADRREVFPDDPGNGTPLMVYAPRMSGWGTLGRVLDTGEVDDNTGAVIVVPPDVLTWLEDAEDNATEWLEGEG